MKLAHFVITRFCIRDREWLAHLDGPWFGATNPLRRRNVALRLRLLEMICRPALLAQTNQDFTWVLVTDANLPAAARRRLAELAEGRERVFIHEYRARAPDRVEALDWLERLFRAQAPDYVLTTLCDDDDALPRRYIETLQRHAAGLTPPPPFKLLASRNTMQWHMAFSRDAPRGWASPWRAAGGPVRLLQDGGFHVTIASPGFSLLCRYPAFNFSVLGMKPTLAQTYFDFGVPAPMANAAIYRERFLKAARDAGVPRIPNREEAFFDASDAGAAVMSNHGANLQPRRPVLFDATWQRVAGAGAFPDAAIDWEAVDRHARHFRVAARAVRRMELALHGKKGARRAAMRRAWRRLAAGNAAAAPAVCDAAWPAKERRLAASPSPRLEEE